MSTKPFKDIEQVIRNAAEGHEPPFEEGAWSKMEALLDKEKDRRKPLFWLWWLLPILMAGSVGGYFIFKDEHRKNNLPDIVAVEKKGSLSPTEIMDKAGLPIQENSNQAGISEDPVKTTTGIDNSPSPGSKQRPVSKKNAVSKNISAGIPGADNANILVNGSKVTEKVRSNTKIKIESNPATADADPQAENKEEILNKTGIEQLKENEIPAGERDTKKSEPLTSDKTGDKVAPPANKSPAKQKMSKTNSSRFYFIAAAGVAGSGVNLFSVDKISPTGGLTIGYQLSKKMSLQTGFFAGSKKYVAGPGDYNPKDGTYWSTVDITSVDANCLVYEIPLNARYDFKPGKVLNVFALAGLSSYIMKKEEYHYTYNSYGYPHYGKADYTGNQHLFSVLKLSGGVEKNISKTLALHAAPSFSIPLAGVGEGQVKLYSTELLIGIRYQPFKKIKDK